MMSNARQNGGKARYDNIASAPNQWYSKDLVFWLAQMIVCIMTLGNFLAIADKLVVDTSIDPPQLSVHGQF